jgi:hypothetical protein
MPPGGEEPRIDTNRPSIARVRNALLGGKDNYDVDRQIYRRLLEIEPNAVEFARELRHWRTRAVRFLATEVGIDQFLDLDAGLPAVENTHQIAQRGNPHAQVVYVDNDPLVISHGRAILEENENTFFVAANARNPEELLRHHTIVTQLDLTRPIAVMHSATLSYVQDDQEAHDILGRYVAALAPGSYVGLTHFLDPEDGGELSARIRELEVAFNDLTGAGRARTRGEIASLMDGLDLVEPGLVRPVDWWPDGPRRRPLADVHSLALAALGRKP